MAVGRVKQNMWRESWVGAIATVGDPLGRTGSWLAGADFTYATSRFRGDKNFLVGVWGLATGRDGSRRRSQRARVQGRLPERPVGHRAHLQADRPRLRSIARIRAAAGGASLQPERQQSARGCRAGRSSSCSTSSSRRSRPICPDGGRAIACSSRRSTGGSAAATGSSSTSNPTGERLVEPFEIADGVSIPPGSYHWRRYRLEVGTAQKRRLYAQVTWWFGGFYDGDLDQIDVDRRLESRRRSSPSSSPASATSAGCATRRFHADARRQRLRVNVSPDLSIASYVQYDTDSDSVGVNTRLRWTFRPVGDLFVVYNHNVRVAARSLAARLEPAAGEAPVRVAILRIPWTCYTVRQRRPNALW